MSHTLGTFVWFLWQASIVGGLGAVFFWIPFLALSVAASWAFTHAVIDRRKLWLVFMLPMLWVFIGLWGTAFEGAGLPHPVWATYPIKAALPGYFAMALFLIWYLEGAFLFTVLFAIINLYFLVAMTFLAGMNVTGIWL